MDDLIVSQEDRKTLLTPKGINLGFPPSILFHTRMTQLTSKEGAGEHEDSARHHLRMALIAELEERSEGEGGRECRGRRGEFASMRMEGTITRSRRCSFDPLKPSIGSWSKNRKCHTNQQRVLKDRNKHHLLMVEVEEIAKLVMKRKRSDTKTQFMLEI